MLKERRNEAARIVTKAFRDCETAADTAAEHAALAIAQMIEQRRRAKVHPSTGTAALQLMAAGLGQLIEGHASIASAHPLLREIGDALTVDTGDDGTPPNAVEQRVISISLAA